jgi:hypothetical protein
MNRTRVCQTSALALAGLLIAPLSALAQTQPPGAPPPPPPEAAPPPPPPPVAAAPAMPRAEGDMTGSLGFGIGVIPSTQIVGTAGQVALKYWYQENLALVPALNLSIAKAMGTNTNWTFNPELVALYVPWRNTSTRLEIGGGLGFSFGKNAPATDTLFNVYLPIQGGVEHFFTRWFSLGIAARTNFFAWTKQGDAWNFAFDINTAAFLGQLFFYTD